MAVTLKRQRPAVSPSESVSEGKKPPSRARGVSLERPPFPTVKSKASNNLSDYAQLIYGEPGCGKTTLAAQFPRALHFLFEPGGTGTSLYDRPILSWPE